MSSPVLASELPRYFAIFDPSAGSLYMAGGRTEIENYQAFEYFDTTYAELTSGTHTRFYLDPSRKKDASHEGLVHVRCCYNNKYLVAKQQDIVDVLDIGLLVDGKGPTVTVNLFVFAMADEPEEDLSKPSCTLFRILVEESDYHHDLIKFGRHHRVSFVHPQSKEKVGIVIHYKENLGVLSNKKNVFKEVIILDVSEQIILPPLVVFKFIKDEKNFYLKQIDEQGIQLASTDIGDKNARFQTFNYSNGSVRIKSVGNNKFLTLDYWSDEDRVKPNGSSIDDRDCALFKALKTGDFIALEVLSDTKKHKGATTFLRVLGDDWIADGEESITEQTKFRLEEAVLSREIYNVQYHPPQHARVYDTQNMSLTTATAINRTSKENTVKSSVSITTKQSSKWEATVTHKANVQFTFSAGFSLSILNINSSMQAQYGYEFSRSDTWGTATENEKEQMLEYEVSVPANKKVTLSVTAMQAKYDVPFSYTQKDKLYDGRTVIANHDDGLYSGMNCFDLHYETREEEILIPSKEENIIEIPSKE